MHDGDTDTIEDDVAWDAAEGLEGGSSSFID